MNMKHRIIAAIIAVIMTAASVSAAPMPAESDEPERAITEYAVPKGEHWSVAEKYINGTPYAERAVKDASPYECPTTASTAGEANLLPAEKDASEGMKFIATAYCPCAKCCGQYAYNRPLDENGEPIVYTATGTRATQGRTIAVDPRVIPYGTHVLINGQEYVAEDCGGAIRGQHIDVYFNNHADAAAFAVQTVTLEIIG